MVRTRHRHSGFTFLPNVALADVAFAVRADSLPALFESSARGLTEVMVDRRSLVARIEKKVELGPASVDILLYDFLTELIVMKDVDSLLFKEIKVSFSPGKDKKITSRMRGEEIDRDRHKLRNDVKAVTMHMFGVKKKAKGDGWEATVVLDI
ncbi:MAG: archease [Thaumarchaeota archaeon]|nr:archease [Nitrososphaerota archaeon]